jgi:oligopeptide/dipeptide ABC transporter ATP-binding protein
MNLLTIRDLSTYFYTYAGVVKALDGLNLDIYRGEAFGLVGETGCGKSVTALSIMRLIPWPPGKIVKGEIIFKGEDLLKKSEAEMRRIRGNKMSMIFQEPMTSLNPVFRIGDQIADIIMSIKGVDKKAAMERALKAVKAVNIPDPEKVLKRYPHELSGGMRQRVLIAMATSCNPDLLIADEPTTFLDVTIEAQILHLMKGLREEIGASMLMITHNLGLVAHIFDRVGVMYAGNIVESGRVEQIFERPKHPYTQGLLRAVPRLTKEKGKLYVIQGNVPNLIDPPKGCRFHPRCPKSLEICQKQKPEAIEVEDGHLVSCFLCQQGKGTD